MAIAHTEQENRRATMKDVARRAGVTIGTVSHVINGTAPISEETTARVREAIRELNYVPNLAARHMRRKEKRQIGLLIPKLDNNFYARIASVLMEDAYQEDYTVLMLSYEYSSEKEKRGLVNMVQNDTETIVIVNGEDDEKIIAVPFNDPMYNTYKDISELPVHIFDEMRHFFSVYKSLEGKETVVDEVQGRESAIKAIKHCIDNYVAEFCR